MADHDPRPRPTRPERGDADASARAGFAHWWPSPATGPDDRPAAEVRS